MAAWRDMLLSEVSSSGGFSHFLLGATHCGGSGAHKLLGRSCPIRFSRFHVQRVASGTVFARTCSERDCLTQWLQGEDPRRSNQVTQTRSVRTIPKALSFTFAFAIYVHMLHVTCYMLHATCTFTFIFTFFESCILHFAFLHSTICILTV